MDTDYTDAFNLAVLGILSVSIRVYPWLEMKTKKKKVAFSRRTWQINPG
jgi:hypothetical protein